MRISFNSAKFSAARPLHPAYNFAATMTTTYRDWKYCSSLFGPCLLRQNGWIDQGTTWYKSRPRPRRHSRKDVQQPPLFAPALLWLASPQARILSIILSYWTC